MQQAESSWEPYGALKLNHLKQKQIYNLYPYAGDISKQLMRLESCPYKTIQLEKCYQNTTHLTSISTNKEHCQQLDKCTMNSSL